MILLTLYKLLDYKTFIQKRSSIRTLNVMDRGPSKVFMIFKTYNLTCEQPGLCLFSDRSLLNRQACEDHYYLL